MSTPTHRAYKMIASAPVNTELALAVHLTGHEFTTDGGLLYALTYAGLVTVYAPGGAVYGTVEITGCDADTLDKAIDDARLRFDEDTDNVADVHLLGSLLDALLVPHALPRDEDNPDNPYDLLDDLYDAIRLRLAVGLGGTATVDRTSNTVEVTPDRSQDRPKVLFSIRDQEQDLTIEREGWQALLHGGLFHEFPTNGPDLDGSADDVIDWAMDILAIAGWKECARV
jgi:hypothetical protein